MVDKNSLSETTDSLRIFLLILETRVSMGTVLHTSKLK